MLMTTLLAWIFFFCVCKRFWRSVERIKSASRYGKCTKQDCLWPEFAFCINKGWISMQINITDFSSWDAALYVSQGRSVGRTVPLAVGEVGRVMTAGINDPRRKKSSLGYCKRVLTGSYFWTQCGHFKCLLHRSLLLRSFCRHPA